MLQRVEAEGAGGCRLGSADDAEDAALFAQLVAIRVKEGVGEVHFVSGGVRPGTNGDVVG
jgi:hypothetical protein